MEESVGVGTRGTIGSLMSRELQYLGRTTNPQRKPPGKLQCGAVSVFCEQSCSFKRPQEEKRGRIQRPCLVKCRSEGRNVRKRREKGRKSVSDMEEWGSGCETPMLDWQHEKQRNRKTNGFSFVDVVDLKCTGNVYTLNNRKNDQSWGLTAIASRFMKRMSFSKLSVSA